MHNRRHGPHTQPQVLAAIRRDLTNWRQWIATGVVMVYASLAGASIVAFTWLSERALAAFDALRSASPVLPFVWTPLMCAALVWVTRRFFPGASGSGIPQVMAALHPSVTPADRPFFVSLRLAVAKVVLTGGGLLSGLAIGGEGPSVQIAAGVMLQAR